MMEGYGWVCIGMYISVLGIGSGVYIYILLCVRLPSSNIRTKALLSN